MMQGEEAQLQLKATRRRRKEEESNPIKIRRIIIVMTGLLL